MAGEGPGRKRPRVSGPFERLGKFILGHAKLVVLLWVLLLLVSLPLLPHLGDATTPNALSLPSNAPSTAEANQAAKAFPNASVAADTLLLLSGHNITSSLGRNATMNLTAAIEGNYSGVASVETLYTAYQGYLDGIEGAYLEVLQEGYVGNASVHNAINGTAQLLWGTAGLYLENWGNLLLTNPFVPANTYNYPAYQETLANATIAREPAAVQNLSLFYNGYATFPAGASPDGWNASNGCWNKVPSEANIVACSDAMIRALHANLTVGGLHGEGPFDAVVLSDLNLMNFTYAAKVNATTMNFLASSSGVTLTVLNATLNATRRGDPALTSTPSELESWAFNCTRRGTVATYSPAVPSAMYREFVDGPADNLTIIVLALHVGDDSPQAENVVSGLDRITPQTLARVAPSGQIGWVQTGDAALVVTESNAINADTDAILPITVVLLLAITGLYFRAPLTPVLVIITVGLALLLGLAAMVITSMLTGVVTESSLTLLVTFTLGVGTDYSVFLTARYREELWAGRTHEQALVSAVTWAGESIATSGSTVVLATLAMTFSGASLISDWGKVLSTGVTIALLVALTLVPAVLHLIGPRIFWPYTGKRFARQAERRREATRKRNTYFHRASRFSTRHPAVVLTLAALVSLPLVYLALTAPLSYAYFGQLPTSMGPAQGLDKLSGNFGPGYVFPLDILVTFHQPLLPSCPSSPGPAAGPPCSPTSLNVGEFVQAYEVAQLLNRSSGVTSVSSLFGGAGAPLSSWLNLTSTKPVPQAALLATFANYVGVDGETVSYTVALDTNGNSNQAVDQLNGIEGNLSSYASHHGAISGLYYGGASSITKDLQAQLAQSSERMVLIIVVGLLIVLFLALGSAALPPLALITIAISAAWSWALTYAVFVLGLGLSLFFYIPPVLFLLIMGLGMDYNVFILTRIREERMRGNPPKRAVVDAVAHTAGIITAAAVILGGAFFALVAAQVTLLRVLGFAVGAAVILDAAVVRTYLVPAILGAGGDKIWWSPKFLRFRIDPASAPVRKFTKKPIPPPTGTSSSAPAASPSPAKPPERSEQPEP